MPGKARKMNIEKMIAGGVAKEWEHPKTGEIRYYVQIERLPFVSIHRYNSGNINHAYIADDKISNASAGRLLNSKIWIDAKGDANYREIDSRAISTIELVIEEMGKAYPEGEQNEK
jgi:hypothetical protein